VVQGIQDLQPRPGERVLVMGAGPIGLFAVALAVEAGCVVTVAGRGESRLSLARRLGASNIVDMAGREDLEAAVRFSAPAAVFDAVFEAVGKPTAWEAATRLVRKGGRVNFFGGCPSGTSVTLETSLLHYSNLTLLASFHHTPRSIRTALDLIERGVIRVGDFVDGEASLDELPELFRSMAQGNRSVKTCIRMNGGSFLVFPPAYATDRCDSPVDLHRPDGRRRACGLSESEVQGIPLRIRGFGDPVGAGGFGAIAGFRCRGGSHRASGGVLHAFEEDRQVHAFGDASGAVDPHGGRHDLLRFHRESLTHCA
jgi:hypothetical protein